MKDITMYYYNKLRQLNSMLAKTKYGRSLLMNQAVAMAHTILINGKYISLRHDRT